jgi:hypothetical protein
MCSEFWVLCIGGEIIEEYTQPVNWGEEIDPVNAKDLSTLANLLL